MAKRNTCRFETQKFIHTAQIGGIEAYTFDEGPARGVRALCVNTGAGLRYRVLVDRGMDIDQAFVHQHSLTFLSYKGVTPPTRGLDRGADWLKSFSGGLLTSCGPFNVGQPGQDAGEELGMHGPHSNTGATIESIIQPDPRAGRLQMSITGRIRHGAIFGPCVELCRTITSTLGRNAIDVVDEFHNAGNQPVPHAWLLHVNFGYPLVNVGAELCYDSPRVEPNGGSSESMARFKPGRNAKNILAPRDSYRGRNSAVASLFPRATDHDGRTTVGIVNRKLSLGVALHYSTHEFGRCINWQHWGPGEYATSLEPANGTGEGRWKDRERGLLDTLEAGARKTYRYTIEAVTERAGLAALRALNDKEH
ncbi:DUF4432 family protein [Corallococcus sp. CA053C]|uniref:DUF4432 family protein n=1 Tax=Corallococcus sp. CA053C TaxID=2316732 RepID=UPI000EA07936|nr:DUF4432 family protein [Corallococcus sp. CA053C]RKH12585.1 DUF4432 family protein [Corallococcus sp. CA053C]